MMVIDLNYPSLDYDITAPYAPSRYKEEIGNQSIFPDCPCLHEKDFCAN